MTITTEEKEIKDVGICLRYRAMVRAVLFFFFIKCTNINKQFCTSFILKQIRKRCSVQTCRPMLITEIAKLYLNYEGLNLGSSKSHCRFAAYSEY